MLAIPSSVEYNEVIMQFNKQWLKILKYNTLRLYVAIQQQVRKALKDMGLDNVRRRKHGQKITPTPLR